MFKFLHAADVHLDSPLRGLERYEGAPVEEIRNATRRALENLVRLAIDERVAFVLLAGDLYDGDWRDHGTGLFLNAQMARLRDAGIGAYLIQGNHDAASQMTRHLALPENVRRLSTTGPETLIDDDLGVAVHGQGFATRSVTDNIAAAYPPAQPGYFNIGLLHTCADGREGHEPYAPCSLDDLRARGYDYWALGHIHKREVLHDDPPIVFPGNLQGRHARETGAKGCTLVAVGGGGRPSAEHRALDVLRWERCRVDAAGSIDADDLLGRVHDRLAEALSDGDGRLLAIRVEIVGRCAAHRDLAGKHEDFEAQVRDLARDLGGRVWVEKVRLATSSPREADLGDGPLSVLAQYLDELRRDDGPLLRLAAGELADLKRKLPADLARAEDPLDLDSPALLREALDHAEAIISRELLAS